MDEAKTSEFDAIAEHPDKGPAPKPAEIPDEGPDEELEPDAVTGASPGTAQACTELGLNSLEENLQKFNIKPPGVA